MAGVLFVITEVGRTAAAFGLISSFRICRSGGEFHFRPRYIVVHRTFSFLLSLFQRCFCPRFRDFREVPGRVLLEQIELARRMLRFLLSDVSRLWG